MSAKKPILCIELLKTFSSNELENLEKLLSYEYFNTDRWVKKLLKVLKKYALKSGVFDDEMQCLIYREVFDHLPIPKDTLKNNERSWLSQKLNKLMRLAELFLSIQQLKKNDDHKCDLLYSELLTRKQYQLFNKHVKKDKATLEKQVNKGAKYYVQKYKIEKNIFNYLRQSGKLVKKDNLPELVKNLDMYYALDKLDIHVIALSMEHFPGKELYDFSSMNATAPLLDLPQYNDNPLIMLYQANVTLMETESKTAYSNLLNLLNQYESLVPVDVLKDSYTAAVNHCVGQIERGRLEYNRKMFDLYKTMHEKHLLIGGGITPAVKFKNVITVSCRVEEYEWAKTVIEHYRPHIRQEIRDSVCHFNLGTVAFYQKDYELAHSKFIQVDRVNRTYDISVKIMILKCLYEKEKNYNDYIMQAFHSAGKFFENNRSLPGKNIGYTNFIKILIKIYQLRHDVNATKAKLESIKEELNTQEVNCDKRWLIEKIEELERKIK